MREKKRLLIGTDSFLPRADGISRFLSEILPSLAEEYEIFIICPDYGELPDLPYEIIQLPTRSRRIGEYALPIVRTETIAYHVAKADIVFTQAIGSIGKRVILEAKRNNTPAVSYVHMREWELFSTYLKTNRFLSACIERITLRRMRGLYSKVSLILVPSKEDALLLQSHGIRTPTEIASLGVDPYRFKPEYNKVIAKQTIGIDHTKTTIGFIGRVSYEKDIPTLVRAFLWLKKNNPNVHLIIVGSGIEKLEKSLENISGVTHIKSTPYILPYLNAMDIFVMPSLTETSSLATLEAMSCAIPVVTTRVGVMKTYVTDDLNGYTFERGDWMRLARHLRKLTENVMLRKRLGEEARKTVLNGYVLDKSGVKIRVALRAVL